MLGISRYRRIVHKLALCINAVAKLAVRLQPGYLSLCVNGFCRVLIIGKNMVFIFYSSFPKIKSSKYCTNKTTVLLKKILFLVRRAEKTDMPHFKVLGAYDGKRTILERFILRGTAQDLKINKRFDFRGSRLEHSRKSLRRREGLLHPAIRHMP